MDKALWIHLVSMHADPAAVVRTGQENQQAHEEAHGPREPGRNRHPVSDMSFSLDSAKANLADYITDLSV